MASNKIFWAVAATLAVYWLALIYELGAQWTIYEEYNYGWAVPFLCVYLIFKRREGRGGRGGRRAEGGWQGAQLGSPSSSFYLLLALSALLYAPTRFFHEANPIWRLTSWLWALEVVGLTLCLLRLAFGGERSEVRGQRSEVGGQGLGSITHHVSRITYHDLVFPVCFFLVAVPWPSGLETFLVQSFTRMNVSATVEVLGALGIPALQHGNVIEVASGQVSVDPACSGIRSFQVVLMMALFFGEFYRLPVIRRVVCVLLGLAFSSLFNLARTTVLTCVQAKKGSTVMASWHDPVGVSILVACFVLLWLTAVWLHGKSRQQTAESGNRKAEIGNPTSDLRLSTLNPQPSTIFRLALALLVWFVVVEAGTQGWYRLREHTAAAQETWWLDVSRVNPPLARVEIPAEIRGQFWADEDLQAQGRDGAGNYWQLYYFRWLPSQWLSRRVAVQLAKVHGPEICLPANGMTMQSDLGVITMSVGGLNFALHQYIFQAGAQSLHVFYAIYEDSTGTAVLANRRQDTASRVAAALAGSRNDGQRYLEIVILGPETATAARAAVRTGLEKLIRTE